MNKKKAILFDFDGTLIDSQPIITEYVDHVFEKHNIKLNDNELFVTAGMSIKTFAVWLKENKNIILAPDEITVKDPEYLERIQVFPGARATLALLKSQGFKTALVTNSPRVYVDWLLRKHNLELYFDTTITEDDVLHPKPNPQMLLFASEQLKVEHHECIMIDDNLPGIIAGNAAGMITIRIGEKEQATYNIKDVTEVPELIKKITLQ